jgi:hypothetical protein
MTCYNNKITEWTPKLVPQAVSAAGLDEAKIPDLLASIGTPALATSFSPEVVAAATAAMNEVYCKGIL